MIGGQLELTDLSADEVGFLDVLADVGRVAGAPGSPIRANVIEQVVTRSGPLGVAFAHFRRLVIQSAHIVDKVDLSDCFTFPVLFDECTFSGQSESLDFARSEVRDIRLARCTFAGVVRGENSRIAGNLLLKDCIIENSANFLHASVTGNFIVNGCVVNGVQDADLSLVFDGMQAKGLFQVVDCRLAGGLSVRAAHLGSQSLIARAQLGAQDGLAGQLLLQKTRVDSEMTIGPGVSMSRLTAEALRSDSDLILTALRSDGHDLELNLDRIDLRGGLQASDVEVNGRVLLRGASMSSLQISRSNVRAPGFDSDGAPASGRDSEEDKYAISADGLRVSDDVQLGPDLLVTGEVRLNGASIGGQFQYKRGSLTRGVVLNFEEARIGSAVFLDDMDPRSVVHLAAATVGGIFIDPANLPHVSLLRTEYKFINDENGQPPSIEVALDLLARDHMAHSTVPYRRLARWFAEEQSDSLTASTILIAGERKARQGRVKALRVIDDLWRWTVGYGYAPTRAVWPFIGLVSVATVFFSLASGFQYPADWFASPALLPVATAQTVFNPFLYALSATVPFLPEFLSPWTPANPFMQLLTVVFQVLGWFLLTSLVAGVANRLRRGV